MPRKPKSTEGMTPAQVTALEKKRERDRNRSANVSKATVEKKTAGSSAAFRKVQEEVPRVRVDVHQSGVHAGSMGQAAAAAEVPSAELHDYLQREGVNKATVSYKDAPQHDESGNLTDMKQLHFERAPQTGVFGAPQESRGRATGPALYPTPIAGDPNTEQAPKRARDRAAAALAKVPDPRTLAPAAWAAHQDALRKHQKTRNSYEAKVALGVQPEEMRGSDKLFKPASPADVAGESKTPAPSWMAPEHTAKLLSLQQSLLGQEHEANGAGEGGENPATQAHVPVPPSAGVYLQGAANRTMRRAAATTKEGAPKHPEETAQLVAGGKAYAKAEDAATAAHMKALETEGRFSGMGDKPLLRATGRAASSVHVPDKASGRAGNRNEERYAKTRQGFVSTTHTTPLHDLADVARSLATRTPGGLSGVLKRHGAMGPVDAGHERLAAVQARRQMNEHPVVAGLLNEIHGRAEAGSTLRALAHQAGVEVSNSDGPAQIHAKAQGALKVYRKNLAAKTTSEGGYIGKLPVTPAKSETDLRAEAAKGLEDNVSKGVATGNLEDKVGQLTATKAAAKEKAVTANEGSIGRAARRARERHVTNLVGATQVGRADVLGAADRPNARTPGGGTYVAPRPKGRAPGTPLGADESHEPAPNMKLAPSALSDSKLAEANKPLTPGAQALDSSGDRELVTPARVTVNDKTPEKKKTSNTKLTQR